MFSQVCVILFTAGLPLGGLPWRGVLPGGGGVLPPGVLHPGGLPWRGVRLGGFCLQGVCIQVGLSRGVCIHGFLHPGRGSASRGVCLGRSTSRGVSALRGDLHPGGVGQTPLPRVCIGGGAFWANLPELEKQVVRILLEYFLVQKFNNGSTNLWCK